MKDDYKSGPHYSGKAQKLNSQTLIKCKRYETMSRKSETLRLIEMGKFGLVRFQLSVNGQ